MGKSDQQQAKQNTQQQMQQNNANQQNAYGITSGVLNNAQTTASSILPGVTAGYSDIAGTGGGLDPTSTAAYTNLANSTNIVTPDMVESIKEDASNAARSSYATSADAAKRTAAATGGYGDTSAVQLALARQGAQAGAQASISGEASAVDAQLQGQGLTQSGQAAGAGGLATGQQNVTANKLAALGGSTNIYGMNESQVTATINQILQNYQQTGQLNNQDLAILTNLANQPGVFDKVIGTIGTLSGAAGNIMKGIGSLP